MPFHSDDIEDRSEQRAERAPRDIDHAARKDADVLEQYRSERLRVLHPASAHGPIARAMARHAERMALVTDAQVAAADSLWGALA